MRGATQDRLCSNDVASVSPWRVRGVEIRGEVQVLETGRTELRSMWEVKRDKTKPQINQSLVRFTDPGGDHDSRTDRVIARVQQDGHAWFGGTTFNGGRAMRISVVNHRTTGHDIERAIAAVRDALTQT